MQQDIRFSTVVPFEDTKYRFIYLNIGGNMTIEADDSNTAAASISENTAKMAINDAVMGIKNESYENFASHNGAIVEALNNNLKAKNITLLSISFDAVTPDEQSQARMKQIDSQPAIPAAPAASVAPAAPVAPSASVAPAVPSAPAAPALNLMKFCGQCGAPGNGKKFCTNCGNSLIKA